MLNGLLTARLGLAAIEVIRPLPFTGLSRPTLRDLMDRPRLAEAQRRRELNTRANDNERIPKAAARRA